MAATQYVTFSNISATTATFQLLAGLYGMQVVATFSSGSVTLELLGPDGSTYLAAMPAFGANGYATANLVAGTYKVVIATATAVYVTISPIV